MSTDLSPEQAAELLTQVESSVENGEFDPDSFDFGDNNHAGETDDNTEPPAQDMPPPEETPPQAVEQTQAQIIELLAQERAEKLALQQQLAKLQTPPQDEQASEPNLADLFGDFDEAGLQKGIDYLVNQKVEKLLAEKLAHIEQKHAQDLQAEHDNAIAAVHPDAENVVASKEFETWVKSQPSYIQPTIVAVLEQGSASQINELLTNYKATLTQPPAPKADDIKAKADDIINNTTPAVPNSLSQLGGQVATDPMQAVANMPPAQMAEVMAGWTPEQINTFMSRYF